MLFGLNVSSKSFNKAVKTGSSLTARPRDSSDNLPRRHSDSGFFGRSSEPTQNNYDQTSGIVAILGELPKVDVGPYTKNSISRTPDRLDSNVVYSARNQNSISWKRMPTTRQQ